MFGASDHRGFSLGDGKRRALLLHGFMGTPAELRPLAEYLLTLGWQTSAPLLAGFGPELPELKERGWRDWLKSARRAEAELRPGAERFVVIGFSMGGALAVTLAADARRAAPLDALVLIAPFTRFADRRLEWVRFAKYLVPAFKPLEHAPDGPEARALVARAYAGADPDDPDLRRRFADRYAIPLSAADALRRLGRRAGKLAPHLDVPTLIVQGEADTSVRPDDTEALAARLPRARLELVPGGHELLAPGAAGHADLKRRLTDYLARLA